MNYQYNAIGQSFCSRAKQNVSLWIWGAKHTSVEAIKRSFASHEKGMVDKAIKKLVKAGLITFHPTSYGHQYSLNPNRIKEIENIIQSFI